MYVDAATDSIERVSRRAKELRRGWDLVRSRASNAGSHENEGANGRVARARTVGIARKPKVCIRGANG